MLWDIIGAALVGVGLFFWLISRHLKRGQKSGIDIAY